jgi:hypothetical protein
MSDSLTQAEVNWAGGAAWVTEAKRLYAMLRQRPAVFQPGFELEIIVRQSDAPELMITVSSTGVSITQQADAN